MKLSIITINRNNAIGLQRTLDSVRSQLLPSLPSFSLTHIIIDGASTDGSVDIIREYATTPLPLYASTPSIHWLSEPDSGIYNAMNKGIQIVLANSDDTGDEHHYIQILNSGDCLASNDVISRMYTALQANHYPALMYGNMIKMNSAASRIIGKSGQVPYTLRNYYVSTMNHNCCWIRAQEFSAERFGLYDETLCIVSDWKWFLSAIALGLGTNGQFIQPIEPVYVDIDVTIFDASGISEQNLALRNQERRQVLETLLPPAILADYDHHAFDMEQMDNLRKHHWAYRLVWTLERVLNRIDHHNFSKPKK